MKTCQETIYDDRRSFRPCGKKVTAKDPDGLLCGLHFGVKQRNAEKEKNRLDSQKHRHDQEAQLRELSADLGVSLVLHTEYQGAATGRVSTGQALVPIRQLEALAQRIKELVR
jgi:hypothetical protein